MIDGRLRKQDGQQTDRSVRDPAGHHRLAIRTWSAVAGIQLDRHGDCERDVYADLHHLPHLADLPRISILFIDHRAYMLSMVHAHITCMVDQELLRFFMSK